MSDEPKPVDYDRQKAILDAQRKDLTARERGDYPFGWEKSKSSTQDARGAALGLRKIGRANIAQDTPDPEAA